MEVNAKFEAALAEKFDSDAGKKLTVRGYFRKLLSELWREGEGFSGKRPFGNSGWERDLYAPLIRGGHIKGEISSEDGWDEVEVADQEAADKFIAKLILYALRD